MTRSPKTILHARWAALAGVAALALGIAACGDSGDTGTTASTKSATVSVKQVDGVGAVLVDKQGRALYTPDQEATGKIRCNGSCTNIWARSSPAPTPRPPPRC
jgi:predicted lipoprotein with Yx(FWY)xxD motif